MGAFWDTLYNELDLDEMSYCRVRCPICNAFSQPMMMDVTKGLYTVLNIDIRYHGAGNIRPARLSDNPTVSIAEGYLGDLVAAVAHRQNSLPNMPGHYVCYTRTDDDVWYINDDSRGASQTGHPFSSKIRGESISMLIYKNS